MDLRARVREWLLDDFGGAPLHSELEKEDRCEAEIRAKSEGLLAGSPFLAPIFEETQRLLALGAPSPPAEIQWEKEDGERFTRGELLAIVKGPATVLLKAERTALNLLSYMSEIATHTAIVHAALGNFPEGFKGLIDTRKGGPGLSYFEKYAVRIGGGKNHRLGMFDGEMIKDNDIAAAGSIPAAIDARWGRRYMVDIQIEVQSLDQLAQVLGDGRVHMILLDNMDTATLAEAVRQAREKGSAARSGKPYILEASGVPPDRLAEVAASGVDYISTSALVRSAPPLDFHMKIVRAFS
ncbi:MAG: carboxylating nicotinate-nucleotide diphosphorylase [bacterium]|nr:carboxylating nicotinate-nucleotide diphosphorylase [bacterium]